MPAESAPAAPVRQLGSFVLISGLLLAIWNYISPIYLRTLLPLINSLLAWDRLPLTMYLQEGRLLLVCRHLDGTLHRFLFTGHDMPLLAGAAAFALFAATPGYSFRWRLGWAAGITVLFGIVNAIVLFAGAHLTFLDYLAGLSPQYRHQLLGAEIHLPDAGQQVALENWIGAWSLWGNPVLLLAVWFFAVRRRYLSVRRAHRTLA